MTKEAPYWGNILDELMELKDIKPGELARQLGVHKGSISRMKKEGHSELPAATAAKLQEIFGVPYYKIFPLVTSDED
jgi:plasmid maintenance system antidote protein VapI